MATSSLLLKGIEHELRETRKCPLLAEILVFESCKNFQVGFK